MKLGGERCRATPLIKHCYFYNNLASGFGGAVCYSVLQRVAVWCGVLRCVAVCCGVMRCDAVGCVVCCSVSQRVAACCSVLRHIAVCCRVLQRVAICCSVLQCVAVCCSACLPRKLLFLQQSCIGLAVSESFQFSPESPCCSIDYAQSTISRRLKMIGLFCKRAL